MYTEDCRNHSCSDSLGELMVVNQLDQYGCCTSILNFLLSVIMEQLLSRNFANYSRHWLNCCYYFDSYAIRPSLLVNLNKICNNAGLLIKRQCRSS